MNYASLSLISVMHRINKLIDTSILFLFRPNLNNDIKHWNRPPISYSVGVFFQCCFVSVLFLSILKCAVFHLSSPAPWVYDCPSKTTACMKAPCCCLTVESNTCQLFTFSPYLGPEWAHGTVRK